MPWGFALQQRRSNEAVRLEAIARLKSEQIEEWLNDRVHDGSMAFYGPLLEDAYERWRRNGDLVSRDLHLQHLALIGDDQGNITQLQEARLRAESTNLAKSAWAA